MSRFCVLALASMIVACDSAPNELTRPPRDPALYAHPKDDALRIDHLQVKATHNSYHIAPSEKTIPDWSYTHAPLDVQLDEQGVRGVELDLHWDGQGEIRVLHVPLLDPKTTCATFRECLETLKRWSDFHPGHHVIFVQLEPKISPSSEAQREAFFELVDGTIRDVLPPEFLVTPDDVRRDADTLAEALETYGWPTLGETRGRFLFYFDCSRELALAYAGPEGKLEGRVLFPDSEPDDPFAGVMIVNTPGEHAREMVERGYLVRVFAESVSDLLVDGEAPEEGTLRLEAALESGAQVISTDVPVPRPDLDYVTEIPGGTPSRCNPVTAPAGCISLDLEDPSRIAP